MYKLSVEGIAKGFGNIKVMQDIGFSMVTGSSVGILGPSGCGKTTLFQIIAGLLMPDNGSVKVDGQDFTGRTGRISFMQQKDLLLPWKSVLDNVTVPLILGGMSKEKARARSREYFKDFGLEGFETMYPSQLSGGMRQRAALLRTYLFKSDIVLLDEPFGALDAITRRQMQQWLLSIVKKYNLTVLLVTHDVEEAILLTQRVILLTPRPATILQEVAIDQIRLYGPKGIRDEVLLEYKNWLMGYLGV